MHEERIEDLGRETTTLGGGCFWCLEPIFKDLNGVEEVKVGYSGGTVYNPSYRHVCTGETGHAEVLQITFDPGVITYRDLLEVFFAVHDPTTPNRQGPDAGSQYRSIILYHSEEQKRTAEAVIQELEAAHVWDAPIVTEVVPFRRFNEAEEYHQDYFTKNPEQPYCRVMIEPKVAKFRKRFAVRLKN